MPDSEDRSSPTEVDAKAEARSLQLARQHVGAAGFAQSSVLEQIITAGREQIEVIQSLRQVVAAAQDQLTALPPSELPDALERIVWEGQVQIAAADELRRAIQRTLTDIRGTPVEEVSARLLKTLGEVVHRQAADLENLISAAITQARTPEQITNLERVSEETQSRLDSAEHDQVERDLVHLHLLGDQALEHIRSLEASGQTHAAQKDQLEQEAEVARQSIAALEVAETHNREELARLGEEREASRARIAALEAAVTKSDIQLADANREMNPEQRQDN